MSREESIWQTELKDLIWLELQAYHADRTPIEEDEYLCSARESVEPLLQNIMNYRFKRLVIKTSLQVACDWPKKRLFFLTNQTLPDTVLAEVKGFKPKSHFRHPKKYSSQNSDSGVEDDCPGCNSIYCCSCMEAQNDALKEIEDLMKRLQEAESLFPSSKAFAELYPLYNSPEFVCRVSKLKSHQNTVFFE